MWENSQILDVSDKTFVLVSIGNNERQEEQKPTNSRFLRNSAALDIYF